MSEHNYTTQYLITIAKDAVKERIGKLQDHLAGSDLIGVREGSPSSCHLI